MHQELLEQGWSCPSALSSSRRGLLQEWALQRAFSLRFVSFIAFLLALLCWEEQPEVERSWLCPLAEQWDAGLLQNIPGAGLAHPSASQRMREPQRIFSPSLRVPQAGTATTLTHLHPHRRRCCSGRAADGPEQRENCFCFIAQAAALYLCVYIPPPFICKPIPLPGSTKAARCHQLCPQSCPPPLGLGSVGLGPAPGKLRRIRCQECPAPAAWLGVLQV